MSFFGSIVDKIVHYAGTVLEPEVKAAEPAAPSPAAASPTAQSPASAGPATVPPAAASETPAAAAPATASAPLQSVDVGAVLAKLDEQKGGGFNWQTSIVDLLKVLDLDSSLAARKTLATELDIHAGADGTAEENEALHKAVIAKLAANGGKFPPAMTA